MIMSIDTEIYLIPLETERNFIKLTTCVCVICMYIYIYIYIHILETEMATHSSVLAWRILGMGDPGGLPSLGLHRVGHD